MHTAQLKQTLVDKQLQNTEQLSLSYVFHRCLAGADAYKTLCHMKGCWDCKLSHWSDNDVSYRSVTYRCPKPVPWLHDHHASEEHWKMSTSDGSNEWMVLHCTTRTPELIGDLFQTQLRFALGKCASYETLRLVISYDFVWHGGFHPLRGLTEKGANTAAERVSRMVMQLIDERLSMHAAPATADVTLTQSQHACIKRRQRFRHFLCNSFSDFKHQLTRLVLPLLILLEVALRSVLAWRLQWTGTADATVQEQAQQTAGTNRLHHDDDYEAAATASSSSLSVPHAAVDKQSNTRLEAIRIVRRAVLTAATTAAGVLLLTLKRNGGGGRRGR